MEPGNFNRPMGHSGNSTSSSTQDLLLALKQSRASQLARKSTTPPRAQPLLRQDPSRNPISQYPGNMPPPSRYSQTDFTGRRPPTYSMGDRRSARSPAQINQTSTFRRPFVQGDDSWRQMSEVKIRVGNLPWAVTTRDLWRAFKREGNISRIEIREANGSQESCAFISFSPVPHRAFWQGVGQPVRITDSSKAREVELVCSIWYDKGRTYQYPSPVHRGVFYPECVTLYADSLDFGFMYGENSLMTMRRIQATGKHQIELRLQLRFKELVIAFALPKDDLVSPSRRSGSPSAMARFRFSIPFSSLDHIFETSATEDERQFIIPITQPPAQAPEVFRRADNIEATHDADQSVWYERTAWFRQTDIDEDTDALMGTPVRLWKEKAFIDIGRWTTYRLKISSHKNEKTTFDIFHRALADYNVHVVADNPNQPIKHIIGDGKEAEIWTTLDLPAMDPKSPAMAYFQLDTIHLPFPMRYQLEVCLSHGFINEHNISRDFLVKLVSMHETLAVRLLEKAAEAGSSGHRYYDPLEIFKLRLPHKPRKAADGHLTYMRAAKVTPSMIYYLTPVMETSNRIIRQFWGHEDRFLRVKFEDETTKIFAKDDDTQEEIFKRIMRTMKSGIRIGERHYEFLAFGNSQFRENGAYFFAGTESLKAQEIRDWMGNLRDIRVIAKWAARLGQQFSTTRTIYGAKLKVKGEQDIVRNGYTFTDGVGKLSPFLAQWIAKDFPGFGNMDGDYPSLFQFRMGGCKGVVAVDPNLQAHEMVIRKSQYKFAASHEGLDICRLSAFATSKLNRQIISLLSTLGVEDGIFMGMLQRELSDLREAMVDDKAALEQLQKRIDFNEMTLALAAMVIDGFMKVKEPFMMSVLHLWRAWSIKYIKQKAQITIDQGAFLLGCVDETSKLQGHFDANQPGLYATTVERVQNLPEIFFQVRDPPTTGPYEPKTGVCMIARNPSLHPGDLRIVKAVDVPELHHLKDVLVLPQTGDRDLANMCSGGDLDGDDYMVIWDYDLLPPPDQWNQEAMDFRPPKPKEMIREVTVEDITEFFITYMKNNRLPQIAHAHLAWSDSSDMGVHDMRCIELAQLHSCAVDYAKSGVPAVMERRHRPRLWPHFMEKAKDRTYHSKKILGQMYDHVSLVDFKPFYENAFDERILKAYKLDDERYSSLLQQAAEIKPSYDGDVRRIMAKHGIETEFEVWSTFVLQHNYQNGEYKFHEEMGSLSGNLKGQYRKACIDKAGGADFSKIGPFVAAMYKVTSDETAAAVAECRQTKIVGGREVPLRRMRPKSMPLMSFPWLFYAELGKIASGQHGAASVVTLQGTHKKPRPTKKFDGAFGTIPDIETKEGVVHPGEELKLFGDAKQSLCADPEDDGIKHSALDPEHVAMVESGITGASGAAQVPKRRRALPFAKPLKDWGRKEAVEDLIHRPDHDEDDLDGWESSEESNSARLNNIEISEEELDMMADRVMPHTGLVHPTHSDNDSFKTASMRSRGGTNSSDAQTEGDLPVEHCADASVEFIFKKYPNVAHANFVNYERNISSCIDSLPDDGSLPGSRGVEHTSYEVEDEGGEEVQIVIGEEPSALEALGGMLD